MWLNACPTSYDRATSVSVNTHIGVGMQCFTWLNWYDYQSIASLWFPAGLDFRLQRHDLLLCSTSSSDGGRWRLIPGDRQFGGWLRSSRGATWKCCRSFCLLFWEPVSRQRWKSFQPFTTFDTFSSCQTAHFCSSSAKLSFAPLGASMPVQATMYCSGCRSTCQLQRQACGLRGASGDGAPQTVHIHCIFECLGF